MPRKKTNSTVPPFPSSTSDQRQSYALKLYAKGKSHREVREILVARYGIGLNNTLKGDIKKQALIVGKGTGVVSQPRTVVFEPQTIPDEVKAQAARLYLAMSKFSIGTLKIEEDGEVTVIKSSIHTFKVQ